MLKSAEGGANLCGRRVMRQVGAAPILKDFFDAADVLVPIPSSRPGSPHGSCSGRLAEAMVEQGLGARAWGGLRRIRAVPKSAAAAPGRRPAVLTHYLSLRVEPVESTPGDGRLLLIDDVVTRGRTLFAAATRLHEAFPGARIRAFALVRTLGFADGLDRLFDPCVGRISWRAGDTHRNP